MHDLTVIIRTTGRPTLARALASVQAQSLEGVQVLLVQARERGLDRAAAAQAGLEEATTRWALFLDDDDELLEGHLSKLLQAAHAHPQAVAVHTGVVQVREGAAPEVLATFDRAFEPWQLLVANHLPIHAVLFDRQRLLAAGVRFDQRFTVYEDWDFWLQAQRVGAFVQVPGISARYWVQAAALPTGAQAHSQAQLTRHGEDPYRLLWNKWWTEAPAEWWSQLLAYARSAPDEQSRLSQANNLQQRELEQTRAYAEGLQSLAQARARELHELTDRYNQAQSQAFISTHQVAELRASTSWRLTAPLRLASRALRLLAQPAQWPQAAARLRQRISLARHRSYPRSSLLASVLPDPYERWLQLFDGNSEAEAAQARAALGDPQTHADEHGQPLFFSVVMPVYNPPLRLLDEAIESLRAQWYPHWELCLADDASTTPGVREHLQQWAQREPRIRLTLRERNGHISACSNSALALARGPWVVLFDQDDLLPPQALWRLVQALQKHPQAGLIYSDEDKVDEQGRRFGPYFKPAFDLQLLRGQNMVSHLGAYRLSLLQEVGGFREGFEGSQDHDLALRCVERLQPHQIVHIPRVLYHWRVHAQSTASGQEAKPYTVSAGQRAVHDHLQRLGLQAVVQPHPEIPHHRVRHTAAPPRAVQVLVWGSKAFELPPALAAHAGLNPVSFYETLEALQHALQHALSAAAGSGCDLLVLRGTGSAADLPWTETELQAWQAQLHESGVGAVAAAVRSPRGLLHDAGLIVDSSGELRAVAAGSPLGHHGYYGQCALARTITAARLEAVFIRPEALQAGPGMAAEHGTHAGQGLMLAASWSLVWNPAFSRVLASAPGLAEAPGASIPKAAVLLSTQALKATEADGSDPSYSPHLCARHADHRMQLGQSLRSTAAASRPRLPSTV